MMNLPYIIDGDFVLTQTDACINYLGRSGCWSLMQLVEPTSSQGVWEAGKQTDRPRDTPDTHTHVDRKQTGRQTHRKQKQTDWRTHAFIFFTVVLRPYMFV